MKLMDYMLFCFLLTKGDLQMYTADNYLNNPYICKMFKENINNLKLDEIYCLIENLAIYKSNYLKLTYEELDISNEILFSLKDRSAILVYTAENDSERQKTCTEILEFLFILNSEYENILFLIYTQIEAVLKYRIKEKNKKSAYEKFKRKSKERGELLLLYRYNIELGYSDIPYTDTTDCKVFWKYLESIIKELNIVLRKERNIIAHDLIYIPEKDKINKLIDNGKNIEIYIEKCLDDYLNRIDILLIKFKLILKIFDQIFDINF